MSGDIFVGTIAGRNGTYISAPLSAAQRSSETEQRSVSAGRAARYGRDARAPFAALASILSSQVPSGTQLLRLALPSVINSSWRDRT
eukprot:6199743-Pleurochrysis_carterae.AAC.4